MTFSDTELPCILSENPVLNRLFRSLYVNKTGIQHQCLRHCTEGLGNRNPQQETAVKTALFFMYYILRITQMYYKPNLALSFPLSYGSLFSYRSHTLCRKLLIFFRLEKNFRKCHSCWKLFLFLSFLIFSAFLLRSPPRKTVAGRRDEDSPFHTHLIMRIKQRKQSGTLP